MTGITGTPIRRMEPVVHEAEDVSVRIPHDRPDVVELVLTLSAGTSCYTLSRRAAKVLCGRVRSLLAAEVAA